jgi:hypothetical protein
VGEVDQPVEQSSEQEVQLARPIRALAVQTRQGSWVRPKMAGMESRANITSHSAMATMTIAIGVSSRRPATRIVHAPPW